MKNFKLHFKLMVLVVAGNIMFFGNVNIFAQNIFTKNNDDNKVSNNVGKHSIQKKANEKSAASLGLNWAGIGADNISGRTRAILIDKNNPNLVYAGGVSGGLWKSTTSGSSWTQINDFADNLAISCIAQDANGNIYVGTGESFVKHSGSANGSTGFIGKGIYKSTDGVTFTLLPTTNPSIANDSNATWAFVNKIACNPANPNRIFAATNKGLRRSDDGGATWDIPIQISSVNDTDNTTDVKVASDGTVLTSVGNKCFISPNGDDNTFVLHSSSSTGDLPITNIGRIEFAIAPSNPNYIYASIANPTGSLNGIYRSTDKGTTWVDIGPGGGGPFQPFSVVTYVPTTTLVSNYINGLQNNVIAVNPSNPDIVFVAGADLWEWQNGYSWTQKSLNYIDPTSSAFLHSGIHTIVFAPNNVNVMYFGTNGGISQSSDGGQTFVTLNINYNTIQCNSISCSPYGMIMTGTQNNGSLLFPFLDPFPKHANTIFNGTNCGWSTFSYINPDALFASTSNGGLYRSPDAGSNFYSASGFFSLRMLTLGTPGANNFPAPFVTPMLLWESPDDTYSSDSITFTPVPVTNEKMGKGVSGVTHFSGTLTRDGQPDASIVPGSLQIVCGTIYVTDDGSGHLTGNVNTDSTNTIDYITGNFSITFSSAPYLNANILASYKVKYNAGSSIIILSGNSPGEFYYTTPTTLNYGDIIKIQDIIQAKFYIGFNSGIWMTKNILNFAAIPNWFKVATISGGAQCMALSKDGNYLYVGTSTGLLYRVSNLRAAEDSVSADVSYFISNLEVSNPYCLIETKQLTVDPSTSGRPITSITFDPNNDNNLIVTFGNYGFNKYVYFTNNALDSLPIFSSKQGNLQAMPVYSSLVPMLHSGIVLIGTENGVWGTDDITASSPQWTQENTGLANVPVFGLTQQINNYSFVTNYLEIYAGTCGRGIFKCGNYLGINNPKPQFANIFDNLSISFFPNPVYDNATIAFSLSKPCGVLLKILDMNGRIIKSYTIPELFAGYHTYPINCGSLSGGTYILQLTTTSGSKASTKFVVNK